MTDTTPVSNEDQKKLDSGDYVLDPVFGVQPKTVEIQQRDFVEAEQGLDAERLRAATDAGLGTGTPQEPAAPAPVAPKPAKPSYTPIDVGDSTNP